MSPGDVAVAIGLLVAAVPLVALARRLQVPYPVVLVAGGLLLGFLPGMPSVRLDPSFVLVIVLPPLLYWEAVSAPTDVMRANAGHIMLLAIGLAVVTAAVVAVAAHAAIPEFTWPLALLLGAIVSPTDELAAVVVLERLKLPRYVVAVIEGESLLNDASALIVYGIALTAIASGGFDPWGQGLRAVVAIVGGTALGLLVAALAIAGWRRFRDPELPKMISFIIPFAAYTPAQALGLSGVLAAVASGIGVNRSTPVVLTPASRLEGVAYWETVVFLVNALLYLVLGLQLHEIISSVLAAYSLATLVRDAVLVNVVVIVTRFVWLVAQEYFPAIGGATEHPEPNVRHALIVAWSGMRGAVSLAAALAIPASLGTQQAATRDLIVFLAFSVILVTLVLGGLTLPFAVRALERHDEIDAEAAELSRGAAAMAEAALRRVAALEREGMLDRDQAEALNARYTARRDGGEARDLDGTLRAAERSVIDAERAALVALRRERGIDNAVLRRLQRALDLAEERLSAVSVLDTVLQATLDASEETVAEAAGVTAAERPPDTTEEMADDAR